ERRTRDDVGEIGQLEMKAHVAVEGHLRPELRVPDHDAAVPEELLEVRLAGIAADVGEEGEPGHGLGAHPEVRREEVAHLDTGRCGGRSRAAREVVPEDLPAESRDERESIVEK